MKRILAALGMVLFLVCAGRTAPVPLAAQAPSGRVRPPNIQVILTDDHGWADFGAQGTGPDIATPNLDQLARDGVRCTRG